MRRLLADEVLKLKRTWILPLLPVLAVLTPLLGVFTVQNNASNNPEILFDFRTVYTQVMLDGTTLLTQLILGVVSTFLLQREYQERTLGPLLVVPVPRSRLLTAKLAFLLLLVLATAILSAVLTLGLGLAAGVPLVWSEVVDGSAQVLLSTLLVLPCLVLMIVVVMLSRSYLVALAFTVGMPLLSLMALNLGNVAFNIPWLCPLLLTADAPTLEGLGLDPAGASRSWPVYTIFSLAVVALAYFVFERKAAD